MIRCPECHHSFQPPEEEDRIANALTFIVMLVLILLTAGVFVKYVIL